jgi:GTP-binding protein
VPRDSAARHPAIVHSRFVGSAPAAAHLPEPVGIEIAFAGRSNVGKSSLLNALMGRRNLARTSSTPGCTRQIAFFEVRARDDSVLRFADLPGYGYAKRSKAERLSWGALVESYLVARPTLATVVALVDARRGVESDDLDLLELAAAPAAVPRRPVATVLVATKLDKLPRSQRKPALERIREQAGLAPLGFSIRQPDTHAALWQTLRESVGLGPTLTRSQ